MRINLWTKKEIKSYLRIKRRRKRIFPYLKAPRLYHLNQEQSISLAPGEQSLAGRLTVERSKRAVSIRAVFASGQIKLNNLELSSQESYLLKQGDCISLAQEKYIFEL